jgi:hypothetical protein
VLADVKAVVGAPGSPFPFLVRQVEGGRGALAAADMADGFNAHSGHAMIKRHTCSSASCGVQKVPKAEDFTGIALRALPKPAKRAINHWRKLRDADYVVVSFPKSGRTWLLVMVSMLYQRIYALGDDELLGFANFHKRDSRIPKIYFTHDVSYKAAPETAPSRQVRV